jgi:hypothetical protein
MSMRLQITVVVPSGAMLTNALGCSVGFWPGGTSAFCWAAAQGSSARPMLPPTLMVTKRRRETALVGTTEERVR